MLKSRLTVKGYADILMRVADIRPDHCILIIGDKTGELLHKIDHDGRTGDIFALDVAKGHDSIARRLFPHVFVYNLSFDDSYKLLHTFDRIIVIGKPDKRMHDLNAPGGLLVAYDPAIDMFYYRQNNFSKWSKK